MDTLQLHRDIAADAVSTALLLTGPEALLLWPGTRDVHREGARIQARTPAAGGTDPVCVEALPPRRTPTAFVTRFTVRGGAFGDGDGTAGELELQRTDAGTRASLRLQGPGAAMDGPARRFLARLGTAAERRSSAA